MTQAPPARTWLITGCASGFGALLAQTLLDRGERVVATDYDAPGLGRLRPPDQERLLALELDVTNEVQIEHAVAAAIGRFGRIDVLVNNAGLGLGGPFEEAQPERVRQLFAVNALGPMALTRAALPQLRAQGGGRIINISSDSGLVGWRFQSVYCATKHALEGFSEALAQEVAPFGISVALIEPCGFFATPMPMGALREALGGLQTDSPYRPMVEAMAAAMADRAGEAQSPQLVVDAIIAAADDPRPPLRRLVGDPARVALLEARRTMPDQQFVELLMAQ